MTPAELEKELKSGKVRPLYLVAGEEHYLVDQAVRLLRARCVDPSMADFNEDQWVAGEVSIRQVLAAAQTAPMMADRRFVLVRGVERWEAKGDGEDKGPFDRLLEYAEKPVPSTCLVLAGAKLDARRKFVAMAKKTGILVSCEPLDRRSLRAWIERAVAAKGHTLESGVAEHLAEIAGPELGHVADAVERLSLYVGPSGKVTADAVAQVVARLREADIWELSSAVGDRNFQRALSILDRVYAPREGIGLLATLAFSIRKLLRFALAIDAGFSEGEAVKQAGLPPFKAREAAAQARAISIPELERWMRLLAEADAALKGSRRPERSTLDWLIIEMVNGARRSA